MICKLLERLIKDHLVDFLVKNKLINLNSMNGLLIESRVVVDGEVSNWKSVLSEVQYWDLFYS